MVRGAPEEGGGMNRSRLDYVILYVGDLERSIVFYRDVVGLALKLSGSGYAEFVTEGTKFGLYERSGLPELIGRVAGADGRAGAVAFLVEDVGADAERSRGSSAPIVCGR